MILTLKCTSPVLVSLPLQATVLPGLHLVFFPASSILSSARPVHLPDPQRLADPLTRVKTAESPFSSSETSSHQQALHVRRCLFSWVTELSPLLPLLWKRSCLVTETHEKHSTSSLSSISSNSCCFGTGCLLNANAKEVRFQFLCFKWFQVRPHRRSNAPKKQDSRSETTKGFYDLISTADVEQSSGFYILTTNWWREMRSIGGCTGGFLLSMHTLTFRHVFTSVRSL